MADAALGSVGADLVPGSEEVFDEDVEDDDHDEEFEDPEEVDPFELVEKLLHFLKLGEIKIYSK